MDLYKNARHYYEFKQEGKVVATIDRTFVDDIAVKLPCGYFQRFWADFTDEQAVIEILKMKEKKIISLIE